MSKKEEIENFVGEKIHNLQAEADLGSGKAMIANLRRGAGREIGELPQLLGILLKDMPKEFWSKDGTATKEEWVCYTVLTLYALHQQGYDAKKQWMHTDEEVSMGTALYRLKNSYGNDPNAEQRIVQKMRMLATAVDRKELSYHLRGIVQLLRSNGIFMNYQKLAGDLYEMQFQEGKKRVCLKWGQDFYGGRTQEENEENEEKKEKDK